MIKLPDLQKYAKIGLHINQLQPLLQMLVTYKSMIENNNSAVELFTELFMM